MLIQRPIVFGRNTTVGTGVEDLNPYDQPTDQAALFSTATAVDISSTSANDLGVGTPGTGARTIQIIGVDANYQPALEVLTLNGQTKVVGVQTWKCVHAARVLTAGSGRVNAGIIHIVKSGTGGTYSGGVPPTLTSALIKIAAGDGVAGSGAICTPAGGSFSAVDLLIGASVQPGVFRILSETNGVQSLDFEIDFSIGTWEMPFVNYMWWPEKTYIRLQAAAASAGGKYSARLQLQKI
jgi:hypothetical protein